MQMIEGREVRDDVGDRVNQLRDVRALLDVAVDAQFDHSCRRVANLGGWNDVRQHSRLLDILPEIPRSTLLARGKLQVAAGHVEAARIAKDSSERAISRHPERRFS